MSIAGRIKRALESALADAARKAAFEGSLGLLELGAVESLASAWSIERPKERAHGDFASNIALVLARPASRSPRELAEALINGLPPVEVEPVKGPIVERVEIAGPGFVNFHLGSDWLRAGLLEAVASGDKYGRSDAGEKKKIQVEFVSANPTGPMVVVQGRAGAIGDALSNLLAASGYDVQREFYVNDAGRQVDLLARSLEARIKQLAGEEALIPEDGYPGEYLVEMAKEVLGERGMELLRLGEAERHAFLRDEAVRRMRASHEKSLARYGVNFDVWFSERSLHESGAVDEVLSLLKERGHAYELDGALWLRTTSFGDEKDRVLVKSGGEPTYFAPDIAYHLNKLRRGFGKIIDIWGPDHHGYIARMKSAVKALGYPEDILQVLIVQLVRLVRGGEPVRMGKRKGEFVTLDELLDEVGADAARFFFLMRAPSSQLDFDLDLAKSQSDDNPVYYVQYAHARICSIFRQAEARPADRLAEARLECLREEPELELMRKVAQFPEEVVEAAEALEPHRMTRYLLDAASAFHVFYTRCRVLGDDPELTRARLCLSEGTRVVLANGLALLGVSAPKRM